MTEIFQDNVDVTAIIGNGSTGEGEFEERLELVDEEDSGVNEWDIIEAEAVLTTHSTPNYVDMRLAPAKGTPYPTRPEAREEEGGLLGTEFTIDVDTALRVDNDEPETTRLFTGNVANMTPTGELTFEAIANDKTQEPFVSETGSSGRDLQNAEITIGRPITSGRWSGLFTSAEQRPNRSISISELVKIICDELDIPEEDRNINLSEEGERLGETPDGRVVREGFDTIVQFESWKINVDEALTTAVEASNSHWWFDRHGNFNFGPLIPNEDTTAYETRFIIDSSAGLTTPPYRSVKVIGDGVVSEDGWARSSLISEDRYSCGENVYVDDGSAELAEPTFTYRNMEISTAFEAQQTRNKIVDKLKKQRASGTLTLVGFPELYPNDSIQMPQTKTQPMGGERYGISEVRHRLNNDDGFITKVKVEGLGSAQEVLYNITIEESNDSDDDELSRDLQEIYARARRLRVGQSF